MTDKIITLDVGLKPELVETLHNVPATDWREAYSYTELDFKGLKYNINGQEYGTLQTGGEYNNSLAMQNAMRVEEGDRPIIRFADAVLAEFQANDVNAVRFEHHEGGWDIELVQKTDAEPWGERVNVWGAAYPEGLFDWVTSIPAVQFGENGPILEPDMAYALIHKNAPIRLSDAAMWVDVQSRMSHTVPTGDVFSPKASYANYAEPKSVDLALFNTDILDLDKSQSAVNVSFGDPKSGAPKTDAAYIYVNGDRKYVGALNTSGIIQGDGVTVDLKGFGDVALNHEGPTHIIINQDYVSVNDKGYAVTGSNAPESIALGNRYLFSSLHLSGGSYEEGKIAIDYKEQHMRVSLSGNDIVFERQNPYGEVGEGFRVPGLGLKEVKIGSPALTISADRLKQGDIDVNMWNALTDPAKEAARLGLQYDDAKLGLSLETPIQFAEVDGMGLPANGLPASTNQRAL